MQKEQRKRSLEQQAITAVSEWRQAGEIRIMDPDAESVLSAILDQYDGNEGNDVSFETSVLTKYLADSSELQCEKLKQADMLASYWKYPSSTIFLKLTTSGKTYFERKAAALAEEEAERTRKTKLESDYMKIQAMNAEQLREIYLQALSANATLNESLRVQKAQLEVQEQQLRALKDLFASGEDGVAVQKEIMRRLEESDQHALRDFIADKGADLIVTGIIEATKATLIASGIPLT